MRNAAVPIQTSFSRRGFGSLAAAAATVTVLKSSRARESLLFRHQRGNLILPTSGVYVFFPVGSPTENIALYAPGLSGIFVQTPWSSVEKQNGQGQSVFDFETTLGSTIDSALAVNQGLDLVIGISAGVSLPNYLSPTVGYSGTDWYVANVSTTYPDGTNISGALPYAYINARTSGGQQANCQNQWLPIPFDPTFIACYTKMMSYLFKWLNTRTYKNVNYLNRLRSVKLGLCTGVDSQITIPWQSCADGSPQTEAWEDAFARGNYKADWNSTLKTNWATYLNEMRSLTTSYNKGGITFSAPWDTPQHAFPPIGDTSLDIFYTLNSIAAQTVPNPIQVIDTVLNYDIDNGSLVYNSNYNQEINGGAVQAGNPFLAFQTNAGDNGATGGQSSNPNYNGTLTDTQFASLLTAGLEDPVTSAPYCYSPYIEIHYADLDVSRFQTRYETLLNAFSAANGGCSARRRRHLLLGR